MLKRRIGHHIIGIGAAVLALAACSGGTAGQTSNSVVLGGSESQAAASTDAVGELELTPPTFVSAVGYDETTRTPLEQLPIAFANKVSKQIGREDMQPCVVDMLNMAWQQGALTAIEVDDYVRTDVTTPAVADEINQITATATCTPGY